MNLSSPGLERAAAPAASGDLGQACHDVADFYRRGNSSAWLRIGPVTPGQRLAGGEVDQMVFNDTFYGFPSPRGPVRLRRTPGGGIDWTWWGPDGDDEFMNVLNRHGYFDQFLSAWNSTGNPV